MNGIINVLKPPGMTSHDVIGKIRRTAATRQCGHAGTLDPGAAGVLPVLVGRATRVAEYLQDMDKSYRAELTLGSATDTEDAAGIVIKQLAVPEFDEAQLQAVFCAFSGVISQVPPMYSALSIDGVRLYRLAREGRTVERKSRQVSIYSLRLIKFCHQKILFALQCSRGTYVRTLCADIAEKLGTCGHMSFLLRDRVGPFLLEESFTLEELSQLAAEGRLQEAVQPADLALAAFPALVLSSEDSYRLTNGSFVESPLALEGGQLARIYGLTGELLALAEFSKGLLRPRKVFFNRMERT